MKRRTYQYRLYPTQSEADMLDVLLRQHCLLYNEALEHRRDVYKHSGKTLGFMDQAKRFKEDRKERVEDFGLINSLSMAYTLRRLDKAFAAFFRRVKAGEKPGFPRFKAARRFRSVSFIYDNGCKLKNGRLYIQNIGDLKIRLHRVIPDHFTIKSAVLTRKADGRWFVNFQVECDVEPPPLRNGKAIGVDLGLYSLLAFSNGTKIRNPRWLRRSLRQLRRLNRSLARKTRFSSRWYRTKKQLETLHWRIGNQRRDYMHRVTNRMVQEYALIAVEDVSPRFMLANKHLALSASDAAWTQFRSMLDYKAESAGCCVVVVDAKYTSQDCSGCGQRRAKSLAQRWHECDCGVSLDRDVNAAVNVLNKARCEPTEHNGTASKVPCSVKPRAG